MQPNILIFMSDQQRGDSVRPGGPVRTPVLDRFQQRATRFANARCPAPHCCPSRTSFFSGLWPSEHGVWNNVTVQNALSRGPHPQVRLWSQDLVAAGYTCHFDGKWHVSYDQSPADFGWHEGRVTAKAAKQGAGVMGATWDAIRQRAQVPTTQARGEGGIQRPGWEHYTHYGINEHPFGDAEVVASAIHTLRARPPQAGPWCHYIGTLGPHDPYIVPQRFLDLYPELPPLPDNFHDSMADKPALYRRTRKPFSQLSEREHREALRHYYAFCSYEDWLFGQVLSALEDSGQAENTIVIYTSDHGDYCGEHGLWCKGLPCFRGAYDIPLLIRLPSTLPQQAGSVQAPVQLVDIANTLRDYAGLPQGPGSGRSLRPWLEGHSPEHWRQVHATQSNGNELYGIQRSIDDGQWKYVYNGFDDDELYHLSDDPGETRNLAHDPRFAAERDRLCQSMWAFAYHHQDTCVNGYIMVGHAPLGPSAAFHRDGSPLANPG